MREIFILLGLWLRSNVVSVLISLISGSVRFMWAHLNIIAIFSFGNGQIVFLSLSSSVYWLKEERRVSVPSIGPVLPLHRVP